MIRPLIGLAVTCFLVGCGASAPPSANTTAHNGDVEDVMTESKTTEATAATHTVAFKVPGMT